MMSAYTQADREEWTKFQLFVAEGAVQLQGAVVDGLVQAKAAVEYVVISIADEIENQDNRWAYKETVDNHGSNNGHSHSHGHSHDHGHGHSHEH